MTDGFDFLFSFIFYSFFPFTRFIIIKFLIIIFHKCYPIKVKSGANTEEKKFFVHLSKLIPYTLFLCLNAVVFFQLFKLVNSFQPQGFAPIVFLFWSELPLLSMAFLLPIEFPPNYRCKSRCLPSTPRLYGPWKLGLYFVHYHILSAWGHTVRVQENTCWVNDSTLTVISFPLQSI